MKKRLLPVLFFSVYISVAAQKVPVLLQGGEAKPAFTKMECLNKLPKEKDCYCNQYNYTYYIKDYTLQYIVSTTSKVDQLKNAVTRQQEYKVKLDEIDVLRSLDNLKTSDERFSIKNMEGSRQHYYQFEIFSKFTEGIKTTEYGKPVGYESSTFTCESYSAAHDFLEYLLVEQMNVPR
ncbi:MAG: hypothetical protein SH857_15390 [Chitinophagales bacterium]|nr:hypothetical protein [Chitinophagales bacterium]